VSVAVAFGFGGCATTQKDPVVPVSIVGVSSTLKDTDLKATAQTIEFVGRALSAKGLLVAKEPGGARTYSSVKDIMAAYAAKGAGTNIGMLIALSRVRTPTDDRILFRVFGGPMLAEFESFSVNARDVDWGIQKVAQHSSGYGHIVFDVSTLPPRTDIYLDNQPFRTTDDSGRFRDTFTWPAKEYKIKFIAWIAGVSREMEETARVRARQTLHFRKHSNLEQSRE
jgi:hypothetical protein